MPAEPSAVAVVIPAGEVDRYDDRVAGMARVARERGIDAPDVVMMALPAGMGPRMVEDMTNRFAERGVGVDDQRRA